jgi:hypothetical protein
MKHIIITENQEKKLIRTISNEEDVAYHTSNADFDNFDLAFVNSGTKNQAYGYGIYLSYVSDGASMYGKNSYVVEIPSNDKKYLDSRIKPNKNIMTKVLNTLFNILKKDEMYTGVEYELKTELLEAFANIDDGLNLYGTISSYLGSDKEASIFFDRLGLLGIRFPFGDNGDNVVIFNPKNIKILKKNIQA